jgi:hypothetical protein
MKRFVTYAVDHMHQRRDAVLVSSQPDLFVALTLVKDPKPIAAECPNRPVASAFTERALDESVRFYCRIYFSRDANPPTPSGYLNRAARIKCCA